FCLARQWVNDPTVRGTVQHNDRREHGSRALSRQCPCADRSHRRSGAGDVRRCAVIDRARQGWQTTRVGCDYSRPLGDSAGDAARQRFPTGLRGKKLVRGSRTKGPPPKITKKLNKEIKFALPDPQIKVRLAVWGAAPLAGSPADFGRFIAAEA